MNWKKLVLEQTALIEQLRTRIVELEAEVVALKAVNSVLKNELAAARKNSSNSSKPPVDQKTQRNARSSGNSAPKKVTSKIFASRSRRNRSTKRMARTLLNHRCHLPKTGTKRDDISS